MSRQPDFASTIRRDRRRAWERIGVAAGVVALLLVAALTWKVRREAEQAAGRLAQVRREVAQQGERLRSLAERREARARRAAEASSAPLQIVASLAALLPGSARLERLTIDYTEAGRLDLQVEARDASAWDRLLERMERDPRLAEVQPGPEAREGEVRSVVRARWRGGR